MQYFKKLFLIEIFNLFLELHTLNYLLLAYFFEVLPNSLFSLVKNISTFHVSFEKLVSNLLMLINLIASLWIRKLFDRLLGIHFFLFLFLLLVGLRSWFRVSSLIKLSLLVVIIKSMIMQSLLVLI